MTKNIVQGCSYDIKWILVTNTSMSVDMILNHVQLQRTFFLFSQILGEYLMDIVNQTNIDVYKALRETLMKKISVT